MYESAYVSVGFTKRCFPRAVVCKMNFSMREIDFCSRLLCFKFGRLVHVIGMSEEFSKVNFIILPYHENVIDKSFPEFGEMGFQWQCHVSVNMALH